MPAIDDRFGHGAILLLSILVISASLVLTVGPHEHLQLDIPFLGVTFPIASVCLSKGVLGIDCPGCGLTRSFAALSHGHFLDAVSFNPMGPLIYALCLFQIPYRAAILWNPRIKSKVFDRILELGSVVFLCAIAVAWIIKFVMSTLR